MGKISIFACGGTGTNIGAKFADDHGEVAEGLAQIDTYFIDTSRSNLSANIPDNRVYLFKDKNGKALDGNGKLRAANYDIISESSNIAEILHKFPSGDLNLVLHSGGGGTGSVAGPLIAKELISRGENVIVLMIGSTISRMDVNNTLKTLKTYENLAVKLEKPINVLYRENTQAYPRAKIDAEMEQYIFLLSSFFSGQNHGLDTADLRNFLNYTGVTNYKPRLTALDIFAGEVHIPEGSLGITAVSLTSESTEVEHKHLFDYQVNGVLPEGAVGAVKSHMPLHAVIFSGFFTSVVNKLNGLLSDHDDKAKRMANRSIIGSDDTGNNDGMVL